MSASLSTADRRPISSVAIIGNDAVLAAAPATPVQLAHACLRRGFTVAVPASWGDELVAAEAVRRLATRERGPAVMCVCPFVRSRLLAPGPDLAPFLVSLVSPPIATARYLRAVYGEHGVHITYIGGCPSAEDSTIDARLTPDAFLADIADHGIALSEQPLVFDSIVPPDRRRWCSLPGGAPSAETLWNDTDTRTLVEIDRDDISTDLAQHIITREHVLLDLAPSLGCVCSGAISSLPSRSARVAVTALEPPRALRPVIEVPAGFSIDVPVGPPPPSSPSIVDVQTVTGLPQREPLVSSEPELEPLGPSESELMEIRLEEMLGTQTGQPDDVELQAEFDIEFPAEIPATSSSALESDPEPVASRHTLPAEPTDVSGGSGPWNSSETENHSGVVIRSDALVASEVVVAPTASVSSVAAAESTLAYEPNVLSKVVPAKDPTLAMPAPATVNSPVRRRTPVPMPVRHAASSIPRATASDGRALPRAYVAKRRTPSGSMTAVDEALRPGDEAVRHIQETAADRLPTVNVTPRGENGSGASVLQVGASATPPVVPTPAIEVHPSPESSASSATSPHASASASGTRSESPITPPAEDSARPEPNRSGAAVSTADSSPSALVVLVAALVALLALGFFVVRSLN